MKYVPLVVVHGVKISDIETAKRQLRKQPKQYSWNNIGFSAWSDNIWSCRLSWVSPLSPTLRSILSSSSSSIQIHQEHRRSPGISNYIPRFCQYLLHPVCHFSLHPRNETTNKFQKLLPHGNLQDGQQHFQVIICSGNLLWQFSKFQASVRDVQEAVSLTPISSINLISQKK